MMNSPGIHPSNDPGPIYIRRRPGFFSSMQSMHMRLSTVRCMLSSATPTEVRFCLTNDVATQRVCLLAEVDRSTMNENGQGVKCMDQGVLLSHPIRAKRAVRKSQQWDTIECATDKDGPSGGHRRRPPSARKTDASSLVTSVRLCASQL